MRTPDARGLIAVDKMGGTVLFIDPVSDETTLVLDDFGRVPHELLVVRESATAYVPIYGDGIHGRNPRPSALRHRPVALCLAARHADWAGRLALCDLREQR